MTRLECCIVGCGAAAITIYKGYSLCQSCWEITDEIPDHIPSRYLDGIIMEVNDKSVTGTDDLDAALARRGFERHEKTDHETDDES